MKKFDDNFMIFWVYNKLWLIAYPFIRLYLKKRGKKYPDYLKDLNERFAKDIINPIKNVIWIHAVSVGEIKAAEPIIKLLLETFFKKNFLITTITPTGKQVATLLMPSIKNRYLPYDNLKYVKKFLNEHNPKLAIFIETEIWPNYLIESCKLNIPVYLVNARISDKSYNFYSKFPKTMNKLFSNFRFIFTQSEKDFIKFKNLGAKNIKIVGNTKYDISIAEEQYLLSKNLRLKIGNRKVIVCGSTRVYKGKNETNILIDEIVKSELKVLFIIVPRHPEFFEEAYQYAKSLGIKVEKISFNKKIDFDTKILIADTLGQMYSYYLVSYIVFIGGSLVDSGCQNIIEPLSCYVPTIFGFSTYNFEDVCKSAKECGCAIQVFNVHQLFAQFKFLLENKQQYKKMKENINNYMNLHKGSSTQIIEFIKKDLKNYDF